MKYFTLKWAKGECSEKEYEKAFDKYWKNLEKIKGQLPERTYYFAKNIELHDGLIKDILYDDNSTLIITFTCGDIQEGYSEVSIKYTTSSISLPKIMEIIREVQQNKFEVLYDEFDIFNKVFVHRFLMFPFKEIEIFFSGFDFTQTNVNNRK